MLNKEMRLCICMWWTAISTGWLNSTWIHVQMLSEQLLISSWTQIPFRTSVMIVNYNWTTMATNYKKDITLADSKQAS